MKITIESTPKILELDEGVQARVWEGVSERGIPCLVFVHRLAVRDDCDASQFEAELREIGETDGVRTAIEKALNSFAATPIDVLVEGARQLLVQAIAAHRQDCGDSNCLEAASMLAFLAHSIGAGEADVKAFPRLLMGYDLRCQQGGGCDAHTLREGR